MLMVTENNHLAAALEPMAIRTNYSYKAICKANPKEFENAKLVSDHVVLTESALGNQEVAIVFKPRAEWPKMFKFLRLYRDVSSVSKAIVNDASRP
ncbi:hypothetical protein SAMN05518865_101574 [Duganella sp. CF458]|uniref:hypothetical protein n=1 Tax=Duganella sp. CF458 TaxID=1884368 RepID=UPI0008E91DE3|nr:hypothetical protein [Duganella sp. CF458]SFF56618.1 hypothetical protein SAMN05518865_101574 [Duganella sp. CF458]